MKDICNIHLSGRLTRDGELKATNGGTPVLNLSIAYNGSKKNRQTGEYEDVSNFIDAVIIGTRAESLAKYLTKGTEVFVSGDLRYQTWEKNGQKHSKHEISVDQIKFHTKQRAQEMGNPPYMQQPPQYDQMPAWDQVPQW